MPAKRESFYRCVLTSAESRCVAHVRAWDAEEAAQLFRTELRADGCGKRGSIEVVPLSAARSRRATSR